MMAYGYATAGRHEDAMRWFDRIEESAGRRAVGAGVWAFAYLAIGDEERALDWLTKAVTKIENHELDEGHYDLMEIKVNIANDPVLEQPRFVALRDRIGVLE
jgi:predicted nucleic acid-binding protein